MFDELQRAKTLALNNLDRPYFVQYTSSDSEQFLTSASLGGVLGTSFTHLRYPKIEVRVGDYTFDNTNSMASREVRPGVLPLDDDYLATRDFLWLWSDLFYKAALNQIAYKRNALRDRVTRDSTPDFARAQALEVLEEPVSLHLDQNAWTTEVQRLSRHVAGFTNVMNSRVRMRGIVSTYRLVNSEGTVVRFPQQLSDVDIVTSTFAADGNPIWNHRFVVQLKASELPNEEKLASLVRSAADETEALAKASAADDYSGPVLFEGEAAAQMMAQVLADTVRLNRKAMSADATHAIPGGTPDSVWASRLGSQVTPDWMSISDDPHQREFAGARLAGQYDIDDEGMRAQRVTIVERGVLKGFLLSRLPIRTFNGSNGHGRLPSGYGGAAAAIGNLFVQVSGGVSDTELRTRLLKRVRHAGLKYGIIIRRIDFPFSADLNELQSLRQQMQKSGFVRTLNPPILAYRLYPDGREELVRGLRFQEFSAKDLRDIIAASNRSFVLNYINNGSTLNASEAISDAITSSVVCPSLLFEGIEMVRAEDETGRIPLVPSPPVTQASMRQ